MDSHVVVAACGESELVQEVQTAVREGAGCRGAFTGALINTLRSGALGEGATYEDLVKALPHLPSQTPVTAGETQEHVPLVSDLTWRPGFPLVHFDRCL